MKTRLLILTVLFHVGMTFSLLHAQECKDKKLCNQDYYGNLDYSKQRLSAILAPGDTIRTTVVVDADKLNRVLVCGEDLLGNLKYKLYKTEKVEDKYVKKINKTVEEVEVYKKDKDGKYQKDEWGDRMVEGFETITNYDTVWAEKMVEKEIEIFDSQNNSTGKPYWEMQVKVSRRLIVEVIVPPGDASIEGCVNLSVGTKALSKKQFK